MANKTWECRLCTNWNEGTDDQCQVCGVDRPQPASKLGSKLKDKLEKFSMTTTTTIQPKSDDDKSDRKERLLTVDEPDSQKPRRSSSAAEKIPYEPPSQQDDGKLSSRGIPERLAAKSEAKRRSSSSREIGEERRTSSRKLQQDYRGSSNRNKETGRASSRRIPSRSKSASYSTSSSSSSDDDDYDSTTSDNSTSTEDNSIHNDGTPANEEERLERLKGILIPQWGKKYNYPKHFTRQLVNFKFAQLKRREMYGSERPWGILGLYEHLSAIRTDIKWSEEVEERHHYDQPYLMWSQNDEKEDDVWNIPIATYFIVTVCTALLVASMWMNQWKFEPISENPTFGPSAQVLITLGAKDTDLIVNHGEYYRLVTAMFLHAGLIHYALNMFGLLAIGRVIEQAHGSFALLFLFVIPAIGGTILSAIFLPKSISVGASGGIFGLMGACLADIIIHWPLIFSETINGSGKCCRTFAIFITLVLDVLLNSLIGLTPFVDNFTHLGGMVYGIFCAFLSVDRVRFSPKPYQKLSFRDKFFPFIGAVAVISGLLISSMALTQSDGKTPPCAVCQKLSCVEFPPWKDSTEKWWYCDDCGQTSADARVDDSTGMYDMLKLYCPDGTVVEFELSGDEITNDSTQIQSMLPSYCRMICPMQ